MSTVRFQLWYGLTAASLIIAGSGVIEWGWLLWLAAIVGLRLPVIAAIALSGNLPQIRSGEANRIAYQRLVLLTGDNRDRANRLLASSRRHHPFKSRRWHVEHCIRDIHRDRGVI